MHLAAYPSGVIEHDGTDEPPGHDERRQGACPERARAGRPPYFGVATGEADKMRQPPTTRLDVGWDRWRRR
jgi:hypothetical protein